MKYLFTAFKVFQNLIDVKPTMTGCYQWIKLFNGDCKDYNTVKDNLEDYDVIQVNLDPMDIQMLSDIKERLKGSSTILIGNHDHSPELWTKSMEHPFAFKHSVNSCDGIFATTPTAKNLMEHILDRKIHLIPHPCETHLLKRFGTDNKFKHISIIYHRYDNNVLMPWIHLHKSNKSLSLVGYMEKEDPRFRATKCLYDNIIPYMPFPDFIKLLKESYWIYDSYDGYSYGRIGCDAACLQVPLVGCDKVYSHQVLYPYTSVDQYDVKTITSLFKKLSEDGEFYQKVIDYAYDKVEYFNWKNSKERYKKLLDDVRTTKNL